jgi:hypothetical protein
MTKDEIILRAFKSITILTISTEVKNHKENNRIDKAMNTL